MGGTMEWTQATNRARVATALALGCMVTATAGAQSLSGSQASERAASDPAKGQYSPYAGRKYPGRVYFGDTHHHTLNSGDAIMGGNRLGPEDSYRFALGEEVVSSSGVPAKLSRPLDFLVISDHAEGLGVVAELLAGNPAFMSDETMVRWNKALRAGGQEAIEARAEISRRLGTKSLPAVAYDPNVVVPVMRTVWQQYTTISEKYNQPGRFTALIGYEWTSAPSGDNLHRNVIFRDGKDRADQVLPFPSIQSQDPEKLWAWMDGYEQKTGGRALSIPHNSNISSGRMFEPTDFAGKPFTREYAEKRARFDVLAEVMQVKGNSETHPALSPNDEFANFGIVGWDRSNLDMVKAATPAMRPTSYLRSALGQGLAYEHSLGANPFKFGFIGGSDVHNSLSAIEADNFYGKFPSAEPRPDRWSETEWKGASDTRYGWHFEAAGYAAVWATENTREALWDAMKRKETYATSGTRMTVRFFGGWDFTAGDAHSRTLADAGYAKGVPMGGDLPRPVSGAKAPTFLVAAMKDPLWGNLDRIQIVKGWLGKDGKPQEKVFDVVWSDASKRKPDRKGKLPPVGDTVDLSTATWTNTIGASELTGVWRDPEFDASARAFYYVRVLEIPTPRWTAYDAVRFGVRMSPEVPMKVQQRAWTSPIWYTPS
jgi:hypothetical protein